MVKVSCFKHLEENGNLEEVELIGKYYSYFSSTIEICEVPVVPRIVCFPTLTRGEEGFWTLE